MWREFKEFAIKGNVMDLAIGLVIGSAFTKIVTSLVNDLIMPVFGAIFGNMDLSDIFVLLKAGKSPPPYVTLAAAKEAGAVTLNIGLFINAVLAFLIIALALFFVVKAINKMKREKPVAPAEPTTKTCPFCASTIAIAATRCPHCTSQLQAGPRATGHG